MSTYYGYAEREAEDNINWSVVGSDITKMLQEEVTRRDTLKKDLDDASREYGQTLSEAPTGTHRGANNFITGFAGDLSQARLMQDRLLKTGNLKVKDYLLQRANLTDGTKGIFNVAKNFQKEFKRKADRMTKDESAKLEQTLFKMTEGFANFNNSGAYINPTDFTVSIAMKERVKGKDGNYVYKMSNKPQNFFTVNELNNFVSLDMDRFKTSEALDAIAKKAGVREQTIRYKDATADEYKTIKISDVTGELLKTLPKDQQRLVMKYQESIDSEIDAILANPYDAASILTDYIGKGYDFEFDPKKAAKDEKIILLEKDPNGSGIPKVVISPEQEAVIRENLEEGIKFRLKQSYTETGTQVRDYTKDKKPMSETAKKNIEARRQGRFATARIKDFIIGGDVLKNEDLQYFNNKATSNIYGLGIREDSKDGKVGFYIEENKGVFVPIVKDINNKTPRQIADQILNSGKFNFFGKDFVGRYSIVNNLSKTITKNLKLNPFVKDGSGKYPYIKKDIVQSGGQQANLQGTKQTASKSYKSVIDISSSTKGAVNQTSSNAVGQTLESSYFTAAAPGQLENIFNPENVIVEVISDKTYLAQNHGSMVNGVFTESLDDTYTRINDPAAEYEAIYIKPGPNQNFLPILLPVNTKYNKDFNRVMDMIQDQMEGGKSYTIKDIERLFTGKDKYLERYLQSSIKGGTSQTSGGTKAPFRAYDKNEFPSFPDYKAAKDAYEK